MNRIKIITIFISCILLASCQLTNVTDITPPYQLDEASAITNLPAAEKVLTAAYAQIRAYDLIVNQPGATGSMGLSFMSGPGGSAQIEQFYNNSVTSDNYMVENVYSSLYYLINVSSHIIEKTGKLTVDGNRKNEIIGEAAFLRALGHFYVLRWYGQFFDINSEYGIVTWNQPVADMTARPRSSVKNSYDQILADLELSIANAGSYKSAVYASKQAALALKAKVLLYKRDYPAAATAASIAITEKGSVTMEPAFADIFKKSFNCKEILLSPPFGASNETNNKPYSFSSVYIPASYYPGFMTGDPRKDVTLYQGPTTLYCGKFNISTGSSEYYMRLAEVYLIQAEALIRSSNGTANFQAARDAINVVRSRVNVPLIDNTVNTKEALLAAVRKEKQLELACESGEDWYDLVRFSIEGDIKMTDYKPKAVNITRYIVPIPFKNILASKYIVKQNPGYE